MSEVFQAIPLGAISSITMGQSPGAETYSSEENGLPFLQGCAEFGALHPQPEIYCNPPLRVAKKDSILISVRAPVGTMNLADQDYCIGRGLGAVQGIAGKANTSFLRYAIAHNVGFLHRRSQGSTFLAISSGELRLLPIPNIGFTLQEKIATVLLALDKAIEKTESLITKYQQIKAGLMHDLFTRGVTANGKLRPPREQAPELYKETPIGWIPKEWELIRMVDFAEDRKGSTTIGPFGSDLITTDYQLEGVPVVFVRDVKESGFEWNSETYVSEKKAQKLNAHSVKAGEILVSKMGLPPCISCLYPEWMPNGVITADMIRLSPDKKKVDSYWLTTAINHDRVKRQVAAITAGVTRPKVTLADFRGIKIAKPELGEQITISEILRSAQNNIDTELSKIAKFQCQKLGLMHDLLTGRVRVKLAGTEVNLA